MSQSFRLSKTWQKFIDALPDATLLLDHNHQIRYANRQASEIFGYAPNEFSGMDIDLLLPERYRQAHRRQRQQYTATSEARPMGSGLQLWGLHKNGEEFPLDVSLGPFHIAKDFMVVCTVHKLSHLKLTEYARNKAQLFQLLLRHSPSAIAMFDRDMRYLATSQRWSEEYDLGNHNIVGLSHYDVFPQIPERWREVHQRCLAGETLHSDEDVFVRDNGKTDWVKWDMCPWYDVDGSIGGAILFTEIITDRKLSAQRLEASQARFRKIFDNAVIGIAICNASGGYHECNAAYCGITGYSLPELQSMKLCDLFHPDDLPVGRAKLNQLIKGEIAAFVIENRYISKAGREIWVRKYVSTIGDDLNDTYLVSLVLDISEKKQTEFALLESYQDLEQQIAIRTRQLNDARLMAEQENAVKTRFMNAASHDLRQPLQSAGLYLSVLTQRLKMHECRHLCDDLNESLTVMGDILDALLDLSRLESGSVVPCKRDFMLQDLIDRLTATYTPQANAKGLTLVIVKAACVVHSDPGLLERILGNFVSNAIRYTERGTVIIACRCEQAVARVTVSDTGLGISNADLQHIFEPYYQVKPVGSNSAQGLGLGLAIAKHIADILELNLKAESLPGDGSAFCVEIPKGTPECATTDTVAQEIGDRLNYDRKVLFIDDDPAIRRGMKLLLDAYGIEAYYAVSGEDAVSAVAEGLHPNMVISDYQLPGCDGVEAVEQIRKAVETNLPAVIITGDTNMVRFLEKNLENCCFFSKPLDANRLLTLISTSSTLDAEVDTASI